MDSKEKAEILKTAINDFVANPTEANQDAAKEAWLEAREPYGQTEAYRFYAGPIDDEDGPEGLLNAWPLDEAYIDYVVDGEDTLKNGIINGDMEINATVLENANESGSEENISVGYHAIEFLLWGQDNTDPSEKMAGQRTSADFDTSVEDGIENEDRRGEYLEICADLLVQHLDLLVNAWAPSVDGNYRDTFTSLSDSAAFSKMFTGIGVLAKSELAGERIYVAYDNQDQEDEHSCFSDNTHRDIYLNFKGIANVYLGEYGSVSGPSLSDKVAAENSELDAEIKSQIEEVEADINAMATPFDFAITDQGSRAKVLEIVNGLQDLGDKFAEAAAELGLTVNTAIPE